VASKLVFFNRFFYPDTSATSQLLTDLAFHLVTRGVDVHVVTSAPEAEAAPRNERVQGVVVHRVAEAPATLGLGRRALAYLRFYGAARRWAAANVARGDIVVFKTDPPMLSAMVSPIATRHGAMVVNWLQDLFPEVAAECGVPGAGGPTGAVLRRIRNRSLKLASRNVVIGERMAKHVLAQGGAGSMHVEVIHNWADGIAIRPVPHESNTLRQKWALADRFVLEYSGNLGRVHEFGTLIEAAQQLEDHREILFVIVGRGPRLAEVQAKVKALKLPNVRFEPHQDREMLSMSLGLGDVHLSTLHPRFEGLVHPSKLYGVMAVGRPTIFIGDPKGETAEILRQTGAGLCVPTGDAEGMVRAVLALRDDPECRKAMERNARQAFEAHYDMPVAFARWESLLRSLGMKTWP